MKLFWTLEECTKKALGCASRMELKVKYSGAYWSAVRHGWLNTICQHMFSKNHPQGYWWSIERCRSEALKYGTIKEYREKSYLSWVATKNHHWMDELCTHMKKVGNRYNKCVYVYEFSDRSVYVGITYNLSIRQLKRNSDVHDAVTSHIRGTSLSPVCKQLTEYICVDDAVNLETFYIEKYRREGWTILNRAKGGSIGGNVIVWTYDRCKKTALQYSSRRAFKVDYPGAYSAAYRNGWVDDICSHMKAAYHPSGHWSYENCKNEAKKTQILCRF